MLLRSSIEVIGRCRSTAVVAALAVAVPSSWARGQTTPVAGDAAEELLRGDFEADPDRGLRLWFSPERAKQEQARDAYGGEQLARAMRRGPGESRPSVSGTSAPRTC